MRATRLLPFAVALTTLVVSAQAFAQSNPKYIRFSPGETKGALYVPDSGPAPHVAVLVIHRTSNFMNHLSTTELSKRGFMVLGMNPRSDNNETIVNFEEIGHDIKSGMEFLKKQPGITKVLLLGHSGGGPSTTYYQATAENGVAFCQNPAKLTQCKDEVGGGPQADGMILVDAHPGNPVNTLRSMNGAVTDENNPAKIDPSLDPFSPANGFNPEGYSKYSDDFKNRYFKAQSDRMNRLIAKAQQIKADQKAGKHFPADDDNFIWHRNRARIMELDISIHGGTVKPHKLIKNDGTIEAGKPVMSVRPATPDNAKRDLSFSDTKNLTLTSFLSANATKSTNSDNGIDWCSTNNSTPCSVQSITVPLLVTAMGGHYFIRDNEITYDLAKSLDKDFVVVEGAVHGMTPCAACSRITGQDYGNATKNFFDHMASWINARY
jgi:pimeloyl-ACP methyl ester carboxylesterase